MSGCWSLVGRHDRGQVVNLQNPGCVQHGVVVHELMHALGFYHQQSAADRDEWVKINWENIKPGNASIISMIGGSNRNSRLDKQNLFALLRFIQARSIILINTTMALSQIMELVTIIRV